MVKQEISRFPLPSFTSFPIEKSNESEMLRSIFLPWDRAMLNL